MVINIKEENKGKRRLRSIIVRIWTGAVWWLQCEHPHRHREIRDLPLPAGRTSWSVSRWPPAWVGSTNSCNTSFSAFAPFQTAGLLQGSWGATG